MRKIIPYILFYFIAACVYFTMAIMTYAICVFLFLIKNYEMTFIANYLSVVVGLFSMILFIIEER